MSDGNGAGDQQNRSGGDGATVTGITEDKVNELINKAMGARFKSFEEKQTKTLEGFAATVTDKFSGLLEQKLDGLKPAPPPDNSNKPVDATQTPEFRAMRKQLDDAMKKLEASDLEKSEAKKRARSESFRRNVEAELTTLGCDAPRQAFAALVDGNRVAYEDDQGDKIVFRDEDGGSLPVKQGLSTWISSVEGKRYMPASGANGSGERPAGSGGGKPPGQQQNGSNGAPPSREELGRSLLRLAQSGQ